jgi:transposase
VGTILVGEAEQKKRRRSTNYPLAFKRQLAQQACDESVSVAQLTLQHGLNTNMLFRWRRQLRAGLLGTTARFLLSNYVKFIVNLLPKPFIRD